MESERRHPLLFTLGSNPNLARRTSILAGLPLSRAYAGHYADGESFDKPLEDVAGRDCYLIHSTSRPVNERLMDLLVFIDALVRAQARSITAIVPYFGYARQDRIVESGDPVSGLLVGKMLHAAGLTRLVTVDFHSLKLLNEFPLPHMNLTAEGLFAKRFASLLKEEGIASEDVAIVGPDKGSRPRISQFAQNFKGSAIVYADKSRPRPNQAVVHDIHGDVAGKTCLVFDDMIDTAGTIGETVKALYAKGAASVHVAATHGIFSGDAQKTLSGIGIRSLFVSDSIEREKPIGEIVSLAPLLANFITKDRR
ncbi:MAG: ribose-phosphate pyrophosphokinase [Bacilli bacterium]|jgi:ribose-phosphate pyrophosphokinase|nr:ribose-phosphate pyrophosphokinase [Bacilli bacterium]